MVAACQFGSIHKKVFVFLLHLVESIEVKCLGGHDHVKIEGKWTKASAAYPHDLGVHLAKAFSRAVRRCKRLANDEVSISGFESVVTNDLLVSRKWEFCKCWHWKRKSHINVLEVFSLASKGEVVLPVTLGSPTARSAIFADLPKI